LDLTWLSTTGVLIGILIIALKVSLGCGLAGLSRREMLSIAAGYLMISILLGMSIEMLAKMHYLRRSMPDWQCIS